MMTICKRCGISHDSRDVYENGICCWCDNQESSETETSQKEEDKHSTYEELKDTQKVKMKRHP